MIGRVIVFLSVFVFSATSLAQTSGTYEKAFQSYYDGNIEEAYIHLKNALEQEPNNISSKILMGKVLLAKGLIHNALNEFADAKAAGADPNLIIFPTAKAHLMLEQFEEIIEMSDKDLSKVNRIDFYLIKGNAYLNIGERDNAIDYYKRALALDTRNIKVLVNMGYFYLLNRDVEGIHEAVGQLIAISPNDFRVLHLRGQIAKAYKDLNLAHIYFERAYAEKPTDAIVKRSLAGSHVQRKEFDQAKVIIEEILAQTPDDPFALLFKGRLKRESQDLDDVDLVIAQLNQSLTLIPDEIKSQKNELFLIRGLANYLEGNYEQTVDDLSTYLVKQRNSVNALGILADTYIKLNQNYNALLLLEENDSYITGNKKVSLVLCNLYINAKKTFKCEQLLDELIKIHGNEASFTFMRMRSLMVREKYEEAIEIYESVFANAEHPSILLTSIDLYTSYKQYAVALTQVEKLIKDEPENQEFRLIKADLLLRSGDVQGSKSIVDRIISEGATSTKAEFTLGRIHLLTGQYDQGLAVVEPLHNANPRVASIAFLYAQLLMAINDNDKALTVLLNTSALGERSQAMSELLVKIYMSKEEYTLALSEINHLLRQHFLVPEYVMTKAEIFAKMRSPEKAISQLKILFGIWREYPEDLSVLTEKQIGIKDYVGATESIKLAIEQAPNVLEYEVQLVRIYLLQNNVEKAQALVTELDERYGNAPLLSIVKGEVAKQQGQLQLAQQFFLEAYQLDNAYALAAVKLYQLALQGVEPEMFLEVMTKHLIKYEHSHLIRNLVADFYMLNSDYDEAKFHYKILLWVKGLPKRENVLNNLANIELMAQNLDVAYQYAERAYLINSRSAAVVNTKAWIMAQQGRYADSLALMRQAISLRAFDSDFQYHLSYVLAKLGRNREAIVELEKALNHDSRFEQREEAIELLRTLQAAP